MRELARPRMVPPVGYDAAADRFARWSRLSVIELEKEAADLRRTWPDCPFLPDLMTSIDRAYGRARVYETGTRADAPAVKEGGSDA